MSIYLSLDLDFWEKFPRKLFDAVAGLSCPKKIVMEHHDLLPHINRQSFETLVNVDFHSDLANCDRVGGRRRNPQLNDGTWGNHVHRKGQREFIWSCPDYDRCVTRLAGACWQGDNTPFVKNCKEVCGWKRTKIRRKWIPKLRDVVAVGIAVSRDYTTGAVIHAFVDWFSLNRFYFDCSDVNCNLFTEA